MKYTLEVANDSVVADLTILPINGGDFPQLAIDWDEDHGEIDAFLSSGDFLGKQGEVSWFPLGGKRLMFVGLGPQEDQNSRGIREAYAKAIAACQGKPWRHLMVALPDNGDAEAAAEAVQLRLYQFLEWKSNSKTEAFQTEKVTFLGAIDQKLLDRISHRVMGVNWARDLVNRNANQVTPQYLGAQAEALGETSSRVTVDRFDKRWLKERGCGLLLAVGAGGDVPPEMIQIVYKGNPQSDKQLLLVGKGITFDTGGLNLKPTNYIEDMRTDMGGAAAVMGAMRSLIAMDLPLNVVALIPTAENAISSKSYKPGDVFSSFSGKTVEITNTDAEGRLILADALAYGQATFQPTWTIDLATLTGAIVIALGEERIGFYANDETLAEACDRSGSQSGEPVWRMPLDASYRKLLDSSIADIKNSAGRGGGSITAAKFLEEFIDSQRAWAHLDIAGTAHRDKPGGEHATRATGSGVRFLLNLMESLATNRG
ncbi:MAG: leucyl aminopeptidase family protein [Chlamydiota bacterium]|nr:leucyl aminopeptidase family protein [Chlamydiota bacterium]